MIEEKAKEMEEEIKDEKEDIFSYENIFKSLVQL